MFSEIKEAMNKSWIVKCFIYINLIILLIASIGVPIYMHLIAPKIFSIPISILIGVGFLILGIFQLLFNSKYTVFKYFLDGNKSGIISTIGLFLAVLFGGFIFIRKHDIEFWILTILFLYVIIMHFLRFIEVKKSFNKTIINSSSNAY